MNLPEMPKFSVSIITYNQQDLIKRAIESLLVQKEWIYEIVICDDCSTDNNWEVILSYRDKHPDIIKPFRNEKNLGIYGNIEKTWTLVSGDIIISMAGDDTLKDGIFEHAYKAIVDQKIEYIGKPISIFCNSETKYPGGRLLRHRINKRLLNKKYNPISLKIRWLISHRTSFSSITLVKKYKPVPKDIGMFCDELIDVQRVLYSEHIYYFDFIGSTYYSHIGVSVTNKAGYVESMELTDKKMRKLLSLNKKDLLYLDYLHHRRELLYVNKNFKNFFNTLKYYIISRDLKYGIMGLSIMRVILDIRRLLFVKIQK